MQVEGCIIHFFCGLPKDFQRPCGNNTLVERFTAKPPGDSQPQAKVFWVAAMYCSSIHCGHFDADRKSTRWEKSAAADGYQDLIKTKVLLKKPRNC